MRTTLKRSYGRSVHPNGNGGPSIPSNGRAMTRYRQPDPPHRSGWRTAVAVFGWFVLSLVVLHIAAILFYRLRGRPLTKAMITGKAQLDSATAPMRAGKWWVALLCLAAGIGVTRWIIAGMPPFGP